MLNSSTANWTVGMKVWYKCDVGYKGLTHAKCGVDGQWKLSNSNCTLVGCGTLESFLVHRVGHNWSNIVSVGKSVSIHEAIQVGDVVKLRCQKGYRGKPT